MSCDVTGFGDDVDLIFPSPGGMEGPAGLALVVLVRLSLQGLRNSSRRWGFVRLGVPMPPTTDSPAPGQLVGDITPTSLRASSCGH